MTHVVCVSVNIILGNGLPPARHQATAEIIAHLALMGPIGTTLK